jgi:hypothetical protein
MRQEVHHNLLIARGLPWPPTEERWWSRDPKQQEKNRRTYHGLRLKSLHVINKLLHEALADAADPVALKMARRFPFHYRYGIFRAASLSRYALQLADVFPFLAAKLYCGRNDADAAARVLVDAGAPLHKVAEVARVPRAILLVRPGAVGWAGRTAGACENAPALFHAYLPSCGASTGCPRTDRGD